MRHDLILLDLLIAQGINAPGILEAEALSAPTSAAQASLILPYLDAMGLGLSGATLSGLNETRHTLQGDQAGVMPQSVDVLSGISALTLIFDSSSGLGLVLEPLQANVSVRWGVFQSEREPAQATPLTAPIAQWLELLDDDLWLQEVVALDAEDGELGVMAAAGACLSWELLASAHLEQSALARHATDYLKSLTSAQREALSGALSVAIDQCWEALERLTQHRERLYSSMERLSWQRGCLARACDALDVAGASILSQRALLDALDLRAEAFLQTLPEDWVIDTEDQRELLKRALVAWWSTLSAPEVMRDVPAAPVVSLEAWLEARQLRLAPTPAPGAAQPLPPFDDVRVAAAAEDVDEAAPLVWSGEGGWQVTLLTGGTPLASLKDHDEVTLDLEGLPPHTLGLMISERVFELNDAEWLRIPVGILREPTHSGVHLLVQKQTLNDATLLIGHLQ